MLHPMHEMQDNIADICACTKGNQLRRLPLLTSLVQADKKRRAQQRALTEAQSGAADALATAQRRCREAEHDVADGLVSELSGLKEQITRVAPFCSHARFWMSVIPAGACCEGFPGVMCKQAACCMLSSAGTVCWYLSTMCALDSQLLSAAGSVHCMHVLRLTLVGTSFCDVMPGNDMPDELSNLLLCVPVRTLCNHTSLAVYMLQCPHQIPTPKLLRIASCTIVSAHSDRKLLRSGAQGDGGRARCARRHDGRQDGPLRRPQGAVLSA